jgi:hypothetical protein
MTPDYPCRKVWREGLEVAIKVKGSQGKPHVEWLKQEHPLTAVSPKSDVHANHNESFKIAPSDAEPVLTTDDKITMQKWLKDYNEL